MAVIAWLHCAWQGQGARLTSQKAVAPAPAPYPCPKLLTSSPAWSSSLSWPSSHGPHRMAVIAWLHCAWQGQGARLTSQKAAAPAPTPRILVPSCSLHRLHGLHRSHGLHRMARSAWPSSHGFIVLGRGRGFCDPALLLRLRVLQPSTPFRASGFATQHSFKGSGFCNPTLLLGLRVLQPNTPFRA